MPDTDGIVPALEQLLGPVEWVRPLHGGRAAQGTGGHSFVARAAGREVHAKRAHADSFRLLDSEREYRLLEHLATAGLCPRPLGVSPDRRLIVSEYLAGHRSMTSASLRSADAIAALAHTLARLHAVDYLLPACPAWTIAERYIAVVGGVDKLDSAGRRQAMDFLELADEFDTLDLPRVLCHGDLAAANVMRQSQPGSSGGMGNSATPAFLLIDFEYAQSAPAVLDLASAAVMNEFGESECDALLGQYCAAADREISERLFAKVRRLIALTAQFWALAGGDSGARPGRDRFR